MSNTNHTTARKLTFLAITALLAGAGSAMALPLPAIQQDIGTPVGTVSAGAHDERAQACVDAQVPQLPSLPALPALPVPVAIPAVPSVQGSTDSCVAAGLDGASIDASADAMGRKLGAKTGVDTSEEHDTVKHAAGGLTGLLSDLADRITSWF